MSGVTDNEIEHIAIIGMAGRFPGAGNVEAFWRNLCEGKESVTQFSDEELLERGVTAEELADPDYVKSGVILDDIDKFDAEFFGYTARQAEIMDPQQRVFLETAWEALEDAGCIPDVYEGSIGVFAGTGGNDYRKRIEADYGSIGSNVETFQSMISNDQDYLTTRIAYTLNLKGPAYTIQTACSTSLVAAHVACQNLLMYQCDVALAGGVSIRLPMGLGYRYHEGMIWSKDGHCRAFDAKSQGIMLGRGAGVVVLKRLSEAIEEKDNIYAVIKGSAVNNDGSLKVGYTAPSVDGQADAISMAQELAEVSPESISYIEAHGTGTPLGDPIEIEALTKVFRAQTAKKNYCAVGSVKTNIGHLDAAAGVASLIKTSLALKNRQIPPSLHFKRPNPNIDLENSPFFVNTELCDWQTANDPCRAGISSFGIGGTNAHVVVEEAPKREQNAPSTTHQLLPLSAKYEEGVQLSAKRLAEHLRNNSELSLADVAHTLQQGRKQFSHRGFVVSNDVEKAIEQLSFGVSSVEVLADEVLQDDVVFMFSGQGSQYVSMTRGIYDAIPSYKEQIDYCAGVLEPILGLDIRNILFPASGEEKTAKEFINQTWITQPALFVVEYSLAVLLQEWGVKPGAMVGHSIGEYVAACLAGVFSLDDALRLVAKRGALMQSLPAGAMLAVPLAEKELAVLLPENLSIAVVNAPAMTVISGDSDAINIFKDQIVHRKQLDCRVLHTSHAFHSSMMDPILEEFTATVDAITMRSPKISFVSNLTGEWITDEEVTSSEYWARHLRETVKFSSCAGALLSSGKKLFVEVGPGRVLIDLVRSHQDAKNVRFISTTRRPVERKTDVSVFFECIGLHWSSGFGVDWANFTEGETSKVSLPTYPFDRKSYWVDQAKVRGGVYEGIQGCSSCSPGRLGPTNERSNVLEARNDIELQIANIFCELLGVAGVDIRDSFFDLGGDSLLATQLLAAVTSACKVELSLADIFENPTVEMLGVIVESGGGKLNNTILPLNEETGSHLIYFVVGIQLYKALACELSDVASCYGVYLPVEEALIKVGADSFDWSVENLALAYYEEIIEHSKGRPLSLIGVSFGGVVAYEVARKLKASGQGIRLLVLLDSLLPSGIRRNYLKWIFGNLKNVGEAGIGNAMRKIKQKLKERLSKKRKIKQSSAPGMVEEDLRQVVYRDAVSRFEENTTDKSYDGRVLLIRAEDVVVGFGDEIDSVYGWQKYISGRVNVDSASGDHLGILELPNVQKTALCIEKILSK